MGPSGGLVVDSLPSSEGEVRSIHGRGSKIRLPRAMARATTTEPTRPHPTQLERHHVPQLRLDRCSQICIFYNVEVNIHIQNIHGI